MNAFNALVKVLTAAAVIAGIAFAAIVYSDKIIAFVKKLLTRLDYRQCADPDFVDECDLADESDPVEVEVIAAEQDFED